jgi:hypothetical protein
LGLLRRTPKGRHALGAAVTSIPSGPLRVAAPLMAAMQPPPPPVVEAAPAEPSVMTSISELIASGEAWASDLEDFHALHTQVEPVAVAALAPPPLVVPPPAPEASLDTTPAALPPVVPRPLSARSSLETALAELLPQQEAAAEVVSLPAPPRVSLGFRDGTSASLDPGSEQALALELLAQSLTRRD